MATDHFAAQASASAKVRIASGSAGALSATSVRPSTGLPDGRGVDDDAVLALVIVEFLARPPGPEPAVTDPEPAVTVPEQTRGSTPAQ